jgi:hypothetical protein
MRSDYTDTDAFYAGVLMNELYLLRCGVRHLALVDVHEPNEFKAQLKYKDRIRYKHKDRIRYREVDFSTHCGKQPCKSYVLFDYRYRKEAMSLKREFEKPGRNHRKIGRLLGYSKEAIDEFCRR